MLTSTQHETRSRWLLPLLYLLGVLLLVLRKPISVLFLPARWEDVNVLLVPAMQHSWNSVFIVHYYYFHLIPTLVTVFSVKLLGLANAPLGMNLAAIAIAPLCGVFFATKQFRFIIKSDLLRALCGLFIVLVPGITEEIYSNISSIQWFLNVFSFLFVTLLLFRHEEFAKKPRKIQSLYAFFCSVSFLSSAFSVLFLPLLGYVIVREFRRRAGVFTIISYFVPTILLFIQAITISINYLQQSTHSVPGANEILVSTANAFTMSAAKIFYHNTPDLFGHIGGWMYLIPAVLVSFILASSLKNGKKFEIYTLVCIVATLFFSSVIKISVIDWTCLCGHEQERYLFFAIVFLLILATRQLDLKSSRPFKLAFLTVMAIVVLNIASGFLIPVQADENWNYVKNFYSPSGKYQCYVGEPQGWSITFPCSNPMPQNVSGAGSTVTFTPPVQSTIVAVSPSSAYTVSGATETLTAKISPTPDSGRVQFDIDGTMAENTVEIFDGQATYDISLPIGVHNISATYLGAPNFYNSTSDSIIVTVLSLSDLKGANLSGANLEGLNLSGANMENANLYDADLRDANLTNASIRQANITGADFQGAVMHGCLGCP